MAQRKIALFGGTFDPVHMGHTIVAAVAAGHIGAEKVIFIPAKRQPLKTAAPNASERDRLIMLKLATAQDKRFYVSDYELNKSEPNYTFETVKHFQSELGGKTLLYWLLGADSIETLPYWHRINDLLDACNLCFMLRGGCDSPDFGKLNDVCGPQRVEKLRNNLIQTPLVDISSTEIRRRLAAGMEASDMLHPDVARYIADNGLYKV